MGHSERKNHELKTIKAPNSQTFSDDYSIPEELTIEEIKKLENLFAKAAVRAQKCGFDAIEIHAAHVI